ncbi:MAG: MFS transporter [Rhodospirillales bacterium]|nr:MFS transporter [Rhodospirillales bacterium]
MLVLLAGAVILSLSMGIRQTFGLFLGPMTQVLETGRESFAFAMAIQNILWGAAQPFVGAVADKYGSMRVLLAGTVAYALGLVLMANAGSVLDLHLGGGVLIGFAMSATSFSIVLGAIGRLVPEEKRSMALGLASGGGSFGQFIMAPVGQQLINSFGWSQALMIMVLMIAFIAPLSLLLGAKPSKQGGGIGQSAEQTLREALREAKAHRGYLLLTLGFFVCGFQVVFIAVHLPVFITDAGLNPSIGATALALIGFFNIVGTYICGWLGGRYSKKYSLSTLYVLRSIVITVFIMVPLSETSVLVFASLMGLLWLGTVPLTSGLVAQIFGVRYMSTLFGIVFFSHQVGSFLGVWLGGWAFDATGSYDLIWYISIFLGIVAGLLHLPIAEQPVSRLSEQTA